MRKIKITLRVIALLVFGTFFHYVLPQHDIVQVVGVSEPRQDFGSFNRWFFAQADSGNVDTPNRDVKLIRTEKQRTFLLGFVRRDSTEVMVYRNEDTGLIWPPYFKFDSENLQTQATLAANQNSWVVITHYGWRIPYFSIFPNAVSMRTVSGPDASTVPWFNIFFFIFLMGGLMFLRAMWRQFRERSVDPLLDAAGDRVDEVQAEVAERKGRLTRWLDTWRAKDKKQQPPE